jgi:hypothetical protein
MKQVFDDANDVHAAPIRATWDRPAGARQRPPDGASHRVRRDWLRDRLNLHVQQAIERFATEGVTPRQFEALQSNPKLAAAFRGSRIDQFAKDSVMLDPELADVITAPDFFNEPDFLSASMPTWFDATTKQAWAAHLETYGRRYRNRSGVLLGTDPKPKP